MRPVVAVGLMLAVGWGSAVARTSDRPSRPFTGRVDVNVVNIEVAVVDSTSTQVRGIPRSAFTLREDGEVRTITNFSEVDDGVRIEAPVDGSGGVTDPGAEPLREVRPGFVAILLDRSSLRMSSRRRVAEAVRDLMDDPPPGETWYLVAVSGSELEIVQPFTRSPDEVSAAVETVADTTVEADALHQSTRMLIRDLGTERLDDIRVGMFGETAPDSALVTMRARRYQMRLQALADREAARIRDGIAHAQELTRSLSGLDGTRALVWIGESHSLRPGILPYRVFYEKFRPWERTLNLDRPEVWGRRAGLLRVHERLVDTAQAAGVRVFAIDAADRDADMAAADLREPHLDWSWDLNDGAHLVASSTGGQLFANSRDVGRFLSRISEQVGSYYSIGYVRPEASDGKLHDVEVTVDRPGVRVRHHVRVLDRTEEQRLSGLAVTAVRHLRGPTGLRVGLELGTAGGRAVEGSRNVITLYVRAEDLVGIPVGDEAVATVLVAPVAQDGSGRVCEPECFRLRVRFPRGGLEPGTVAVARVPVELGADPGRIAVAVRDLGSGVTGVAALDVDG